MCPTLSQRVSIWAGRENNFCFTLYILEWEVWRKKLWIMININHHTNCVSHQILPNAFQIICIKYSHLSSVILLLKQLSQTFVSIKHSPLSWVRSLLHLSNIVALICQIITQPIKYSPLSSVLLLLNLSGIVTSHQSAVAAILTVNQTDKNIVFT